MHCNLKIIAVLAILAVALTGAVAIVDSDSDADAVSDVYYVVGDTTYAEQTSSALMTIEEIGATVPAGKTFVGWSCGGSITTETPVAGSTYTAMFEVSTYDVIFVANGVSATFTDVTYGNEVFPSSDEESATYLDYSAAEGYEFIGWSNGTSTITEIPTVSADAIYTAVFDIIPATTHIVTFMVDGEQYGVVQTVTDTSEIIYPYIEGYTWGEVVTDEETDNMTITAIANPVAEDSILGLDTTSAVLLIMIFAVLVCILIVWLKKEGFIFGGKSE